MGDSLSGNGYSIRMGMKGGGLFFKVRREMSTNSFSSLCKYSKSLQKGVLTSTQGKPLLLKFPIHHLTLSELEKAFPPEFST